ncbi:hypothetical protein GJ629_09580 [Halapricum sp. CBA1109]|uniref:hypothetical protein n=1 Tax=Halapricum sp. CBA1109 TaxID=2668068 RepID=UPI0012F908E3|nr:hypothetical protein [Halapricum sp. CBA1109]MUV90110.1 hypothetical protein [Halapricum sp. CBA1109]
MSRLSHPLVQVDAAVPSPPPWIESRIAGVSLGTRSTVVGVFTRAGNPARTAVGRDPVAVEVAD